MQITEVSAIVNHDQLSDTLRRAGSSWDAAQAHGLASGVVSVGGAGALPEWLAQVSEDGGADETLRKASADQLTDLYRATHAQLSARLSEFSPLLPDDDSSRQARTEALAHWCEGYLHGLVSRRHGDAVRQKLAADPVAGIIRDLLAITQATVSADGDDEDDEQAYAEIVEYVRVAAQLVYEELAGFRGGAGQ